MAGLVPAIHVLRMKRKTWMPATSTGMTPNALCVQASNSLLKPPSQRSAALFLRGAGYAVVFGKIRIARKRTEGARDARGPMGPTGLDASRHRGLSKSFVPAFHAGSRNWQGNPQVRQNPGRPARGV